VPCQTSFSRVQIAQNARPVSYETPQTWMARSYSYPRGTEWRGYAPRGTVFPFRRLLRQARLRVQKFFFFEVILRPTVSRPVCLGAGHPSGSHDQFFFLLDIVFRQMSVCYYGGPSQTRGRVCDLQLLLGLLASAVPLVCAFGGTHDQILFSQV
jgi:hypothetical protein